jgi:hypothetical protein
MGSTDRNQQLKSTPMNAPSTIPKGMGAFPGGSMIGEPDHDSLYKLLNPGGRGSTKKRIKAATKKRKNKQAKASRRLNRKRK